MADHMRFRHGPMTGLGRYFVDTRTPVRTETGRTKDMPAATAKVIDDAIMAHMAKALASGRLDRAAARDFGVMAKRAVTGPFTMAEARDLLLAHDQTNMLTPAEARRQRGWPDGGEVVWEAVASAREAMPAVVECAEALLPRGLVERLKASAGGSVTATLPHLGPVVIRHDAGRGTCALRKAGPPALDAGAIPGTLAINVMVPPADVRLQECPYCGAAAGKDCSWSCPGPGLARDAAAAAGAAASEKPPATGGVVSGNTFKGGGSVTIVQPGVVRVGTAPPDPAPAPYVPYDPVGQMQHGRRAARILDNPPKEAPGPWTSEQADKAKTVGRDRKP